MLPEQEAETSKEKLINVHFVYDPNYIPDWFEKGEIDLESARIDHPLELYAQQRSEEWNKRISPTVSEIFKRILNTYSVHPLIPTCNILNHRIKTDAGYIEAYSKPLAIWAIPSDDKWGHLPFHARLIHELLHIIEPRRDYGGSNWELIEDELGKNYDFKNYYGEKNQFLREELVTRHITYEITKEAFGEEFADWFLERESKEILN